MKNSILAFGFLVFTVVGCGESNMTNANNNCQPGYGWNGNSCVAGLNSGVYTGANNTMVQRCTNGWSWNTATAACVQNGVPVTGVAGQQILVPSPTNTAIQNCPVGQFFNGTVCAATITTQGNCQIGQINTTQYGCASRATQCQTQYAYLNGSSCLPAPVAVPSCRSTETRRNGRVVLIRNGCPNDCKGNYNGVRKIKYNKDGTLKKIKY
jgi:hypothetical protein